MRKILIGLLALTITYGCENGQKESQEESKEYNQALADKLSKLAELDQTAAWLPEGKFKEYSLEEWNAYKDSVFTTNQKQAEAIFNEFGFPGFDLVGEQGAHDFWLIVQHCDFDPEFQEEVLTSMKKEIEQNNASKRNYAYLIDRVRKNTGKKIIYGTQVTYNSLGQAISRPLEDSLNVNSRRAGVGLEPIEVYLNELTVMHFEMNKENMLRKGIKEPNLYEVKE